MSNLPDFCKIKLQYLDEIVTYPNVSNRAPRLALCLLRHAKHETGECYPSLATIAKAIGKNAKTVKRAVKDLEAAGCITVKRGTNIGKSSRY